MDKLMRHPMRDWMLDWQHKFFTDNMTGEISGDEMKWWASGCVSLSVIKSAISRTGLLADSDMQSMPKFEHVTALTPFA